MKRIFAGVVACLALSASLWGQGTSQVNGVVRDATGSVVPGATVVITQTDTGFTRGAESGENGNYLLPSLPTGPYKLEVKKPGFTAYVQQGIVLQVNSSPTIDVALTVGQVPEQVVVEAAAAMVDTTSTGVGQVVDQRRVVDLPLNGRIPTELITLTGAAVSVVARDRSLHSSSRRASPARAAKRVAIAASSTAWIVARARISVAPSVNRFFDGQYMSFDQTGKPLKGDLGTDRPHVLRQAIHCCRNFGTVSIVGVYGGFVDKIPMGSAINRGLTFRMAQTPVQHYLPKLMELIKSGKIDPSVVITHRARLEDGPELYKTFRAKEDGCIKVVLKPN